MHLQILGPKLLTDSLADELDSNGIQNNRTLLCGAADPNGGVTGVIRVVLSPEAIDLYKLAGAVFLGWTMGRRRSFRLIHQNGDKYDSIDIANLTPDQISELLKKSHQAYISDTEEETKSAEQVAAARPASAPQSRTNSVPFRAGGRAQRWAE